MLSSTCWQLVRVWWVNKNGIIIWSTSIYKMGMLRKNLLIVWILCSLCVQCVRKKIWLRCCKKERVRIMTDWGVCWVSLDWSELCKWNLVRLWWSMHEQDFKTLLMLTGTKMDGWKARKKVPAGQSWSHVSVGWVGRRCHIKFSSSLTNCD